MNVLILTACLAAISISAIGQTKDDLVGTWKLVSAWNVQPSGAKEPFLGENPVGVLTYTLEGRMCVILGRSSRKPLSADRIAAPASERAEAFSTMLAYAGSYTVGGSQVIHHVEISTYQNYARTDLVRKMKLEADRLTLSGVMTLGGKRVTAELVWQRLK